MKKKYLFRLFILLFLLVLVFFLPFEVAHQPSDSGRFVKLDKNGASLTHWQGPWSCIIDTKTGLTWENKTDDESIHDALWTYSWFQHGVGTQNAGDCYFEEERCDTADLIKKMNQEKPCGLNGWRLPTASELTSLVYSNPETGKAKIRHDFFSYSQRGDFWTSEHNKTLEGIYAHLNHGARSIDFIEGKHRDIPYRNAAFLRLVTNKRIP